MTRHKITFSKLATTACLALLSGCAADRVHREGIAAIEAGSYEEGVGKLREAVHREPDNLVFRADLRARQEDAVRDLIAQGDRARSAGHRAEAATAYRRVLAMDPVNDRASRGLEGVVADQRHSEMIAAATRDATGNELDRAETTVRAVLAEDPAFAPATALQQQIDIQRGPVRATPRLKTRENRPVTLQFRDANTKMVFEVLSRETGINFIFDKDVKADGKTTIFVQDVPIESAIDLVLGQNQLARQVLAPNMVLLYPNTVAKQKDYQDEIVKTFYLSDADPKQAQNLLKTMLNPKAMFVDDRSGVLVVRDTPEIVRMAEKLIASVDLPDAEVMIEVEVLEISTSKLNQLGIQYPSSASFSTNPLSAASSAGGLVLNDIQHQNSRTITVSPLGVTLNLLKTDGSTNTLASPRIRARNHEKAKILIGQKVPVLTNSVAPNAVGSTVFTGSIQYLDVGLTLDVEPTIHRNGDIAIKLALEVSTLGDAVTNSSGSIAYKIGTRNANTLLQLKDGETQILAGLIQDSDTRSANDIPGLGELPLLGRLFGSKRVDREKSEIVLAMTPRIIRAQRRPSSETTEFWYGTEGATRTGPLGGYTLEGVGLGAGGAGSAARSGGSTTAPSTVLQAAMGGTAAPLPRVAPAPDPAEASAAAAPPEAGVTPTLAVLSPTSAETAAAAQSGGQSPAAVASGAAPSLSWQAPSEVHVGDEFDVTLQLATGQPLTQLRSQVRFDAAAFELKSATPGSLVAATSPRVDTPRGMVAIDATASTDAAVQGSGDLVVLHFKALAARAASPIQGRLAAATAKGGAGMPAAPALSIAIKP